MILSNDGSDPRLDIPPEDMSLLREDEEPVVGRRTAGVGPVVVISVLAVFAVGLFVVLNGRRTQADTASLVTPVVGAAMSAPEAPLVLNPPPPPQFAPNTPQSLVAGAMTTPMPVTTAPAFAPMMGQPAAMSFAPPPPAVDPTQRRRAPIVVVDLDSGSPRMVAVSTAPSGSSIGSPLGAPATVGTGSAPNSGAGPAMAALTPTGAIAAALSGQAAAGAGRGPQLNSDETFAERIGEAGTPQRAVATSMRDLGSVIPQGAMIPGVLETAINSDLPGYTRAIVSRDVRSFDGKHVLIPRGSRLIGQYKSAVALGQSRAFVIWTRVTRPDGVSIQIGSPGTDALGRGGLDGEVDRHFFARFGGSILLSVLNAGVNAVGDPPTTQIAIGSPGAAASAAASALQGADIPPTIKVAQGEAIRIFVSRDLDFSNVGPAK